MTNSHRRRTREAVAIVATHGVGDAITTTIAVTWYGLPEANPLIQSLIHQSMMLAFGVLVIGGIVVGTGWYATRERLAARYGSRVAAVVGGGFVISGCMIVVNNTVSILLAV